VSVTVDANVLLYASDASSARSVSAQALLRRLATGPGLVYVFWPVAMAYLRIATHPAVFARPLEPDLARANLDGLLALPNVRTVGENERFWPVYQAVARDAVVRGNLVPDAHIAALMQLHGVSTIWTADRDFRRFPDITARDPYDEDPE
jgi:toxin-antitoxin system PIN domain toxin